MLKTLKISFGMKNTYRVNTILYGLKQIPLVKELLPAELYGVRGLKIFASVISVIAEIFSALGGKAIYFALMVFLPAGLISENSHGILGMPDPADGFLFVFVILTIAGAIANPYMFDTGRNNYYGVVLMNMNAREVALVDFWYKIFKLVIGFMIFGIFMGLQLGADLWILILMPFFAAGVKLIGATFPLSYYEKHGKRRDSKVIGMLSVFIPLTLMGLAYGFLWLGIIIPKMVCVAIMVAGILLGLLSLKKILYFGYYREIYREILLETMNVRVGSDRLRTQATRKVISADTSITSTKSGLEYLNELFIRRHRKILWTASNRISLVALAVIVVVLIAFMIFPEIKGGVNEMLMTSLPYMLFVMYLLNRGTGFTEALFINCDHSFLTYPFFKTPAAILKLFRIRLWEIIKVNLPPAVIIGAGLALILFMSGGTDNPLNYGILFVSIVGMSVFFSVHYLTIYYLLQPYTIDAEVRSSMYRVIMGVTYFVCYMGIQVHLPTFWFGIACIVFSVLYFIVSMILVYRFAPETFRIRT